MSKSLKEQNLPTLAAVLAANLALTYYMSLGPAEPTFPGFAELWRAALKMIPAAALGATALVATSVLPAITKERLVFWRWVDPLPGARAFSLYAARDPRVDIERLRRNHGPFPEAGAEQNRLWYRLYLTVRDLPPVMQAHRAYLLTRDMATLGLLSAFTLGPLAAYLMPFDAAAAVIGAFIAEYLVAALAARALGVRLVCNALALV